MNPHQPVNDSKTSKQAIHGQASGSLQRMVGRRWKYHRDSRNGVSKWVLGNSWVTKWDKQRFCLIGILGARTDLQVDRPKAAREAIECALGKSPNDPSSATAEVKP